MLQGHHRGRNPAPQLAHRELLGGRLASPGCSCARGVRENRRLCLARSQHPVVVTHVQDQRRKPICHFQEETGLEPESTGFPPLPGLPAHKAGPALRLKAGGLWTESLAQEDVQNSGEPFFLVVALNLSGSGRRAPDFCEPQGVHVLKAASPSLRASLAVGCAHVGKCALSFLKTNGKRRCLCVPLPAQGAGWLGVLVSLPLCLRPSETRVFISFAVKVM